MAQQQQTGGNFTFPGTNITVNRMGYGAMQLAGKGVWGPPEDRDAAIAVLREAADSGVNHIDTCDYYGPHVTNQIIHEALYPYPAGLTVVTKVGARRGAGGSWHAALSSAELVSAVHDNLKNLGLEVLDVVNLRLWGNGHGPAEGSLVEQFSTMLELQQQGLVRHLGVSNVTAAQVAEAQTMGPVICVQNMYNLAQRKDESLLHLLAEQGIAYVPFFPLGGFTPLQSGALDEVAASLNATPMQVALAWLLQRSPNVLLIPGTSSVGHLRENLAAAALTLSPEVVAKLDAIGAA